jgi:hypothetical protein
MPIVFEKFQAETFGREDMLGAMPSTDIPAKTG